MENIIMERRKKKSINHSLDHVISFVFPPSSSFLLSNISFASLFPFGFDIKTRKAKP